MLKSYLRIALRNLARRRSTTALNVVGLAAGLACCLLIGAHVRHELSYDRFHTHADRIVRVQPRFGEFGYFAVTPVTALDHLQTAYPEVVAATHVQLKRAIVRQGERWIEEEAFAYADASVFDVFTFPLRRGDPTTALREPNTVVLTETAAAAYFGDADPMGRTLALNDGATLTVTGVMADMPSNSHLQVRALASLATIYDGAEADVVAGFRLQGHQYLRLTTPEAAEALQAKLDALTAEGQDAVQAALGFWVDGMEIGLYPLTRIHLYPNVGPNANPEGAARYLYLFGAVALFVLLLACINYMNLATAQAAERAKEVGIRKVAGAQRRQLAVQFLGESVLVCLAALVLALGLVQVLLPAFNRLTDGALAVRYDLPTLGVLAGAVLLTGLVAGSYPALILSRLQPIGMLRGRVGGRGGARLRQGLVVFQFAVSVGLIVATLVVHQQLRFMQTKSLGYQTAQVVQLQLPEAVRAQGKALKAEVERLAGVAGASLSSGVPSGGGGMMYMHELNETETVPVVALQADADYLAAMGMDLAAGRTFDAARAADTSAVLLNETALRVFGLEAQVGEAGTFDFGGEMRTVVGVVRDFHASSLHQPIGPAVLTLPDAEQAGALVVRLEAGQATEALAAVEAVWQRFAPEEPFTYVFADDVLASYYRAERRTGRLFAAFAGLAVLIGGLGLFGLATFTAQQRTKEIGVRKVLGATVPGLVALLSKDFLRLVLVAFVVAAPLAYLAMRHWLEDFAYRIDLGAGVILLAGALAVAVALLTVSGQAIRAARRNPAESLRYE